ncbi:MAG: DUF4468 domain-containing protein [Candidatus Omnitrophica bacterium]|nr:DUF4468 domain-containing protein [Candidatus Omnitrophota bacterium]
MKKPIKKIILFVACLTFVYLPTNQQPCDCQEAEKLSFTEVVNVNGVSAEELYMRARLWFVDCFVDSKNVLEMDDKKEGILAGKGSIAYEPNVFIGSGCTRGNIVFTIKVMVKDGRYKYEFLNFTHHGSVSEMGFGPTDFGVLTTEEDCGKIKDTYKSQRIALWKHMKSISELNTIQMVSSLKKKMEEKALGENDW